MTRLNSTGILSIREGRPRAGWRLGFPLVAFMATAFVVGTGHAHVPDSAASPSGGSQGQDDEALAFPRGTPLLRMLEEPFLDMLDVWLRRLIEENTPDTEDPGGDDPRDTPPPILFGEDLGDQGCIPVKIEVKFEGPMDDLLPAAPQTAVAPVREMGPRFQVWHGQPIWSSLNARFTLGYRFQVKLFVEGDPHLCDVYQLVKNGPDSSAPGTGKWTIDNFGKNDSPISADPAVPKAFGPDYIAYWDQPGWHYVKIDRYDLWPDVLPIVSDSEFRIQAFGTPIASDKSPCGTDVFRVRSKWARSGQSFQKPFEVQTWNCPGRG